MEIVLAKLKELSGRPGPITVSDGKHWLRQFGPRGIAIASSLSRLSQQRNAQAHPRTAQLLVELDQFSTDMRKHEQLRYEEKAQDKIEPNLQTQCDNMTVVVAE